MRVFFEYFLPFNLLFEPAIMKHLLIQWWCELNTKLLDKIYLSTS